MEENDKKQRIGVYVCHCGGNISDYVDVEQIRDGAGNEKGVVVSKNVMFACADSNQKEMINDIREKNLDAIVVASCSPKLHLHTFRNVAERAGLNPYNYVQVNVREQCSWAHSDKPEEATAKAMGLVRAGIRRVSYSEILENIHVDVKKSVIIIGAGVSGMRAALDLAGMGNQVYLVEKEKRVGGNLAGRGKLFPTGQTGQEIVDTLYDRIRKNTLITLFTHAELMRVTGSIGNFSAEVAIHGEKEEKLVLTAGSMLVATGYQPYRPSTGEYGFGASKRVITLTELDELVALSNGSLKVDGKPVKTVAFIYCVGMRQTKGENKYCSRVCCTAAIHSSLTLHERFQDIQCIHMYRDIRTYGKQEILYERSSRAGDIYMMFKENDPPVVEPSGEGVKIRIKDQLTRRRELEAEADLVVLVTGMVPRDDNRQVAEKLKIPVGTDKFYNEIHPKLRPVETVIDGVFLGGCCQGPRNVQESVSSALAASAKIHAVIRKGSIELEPVVARVNEDSCTWCGKCEEVCEYDAIFKMERNGKVVASVNEAVCKGCGICAPVCPADAIDIARYTNNEIESMIDGFAETVELTERAEGEVKEEPSVAGMKELPALWKSILARIEQESSTIPQIAADLNEDAGLITWNLMTMHKYHLVEADGIDDNDEYYLYKPKNR